MTAPVEARHATGFGEAGFGDGGLGEGGLVEDGEGDGCLDTCGLGELTTSAEGVGESMDGLATTATPRGAGETGGRLSKSPASKLATTRATTNSAPAAPIAHQPRLLIRV